MCDPAVGAATLGSRSEGLQFLPQVEYSHTVSIASAQGVLVPVADSTTLRNTVAHVLREATEGTDESAPAVHFVYLVEWQRRNLNEAVTDEAEELLERVRAWVDEDLEVTGDTDRPLPVTIEIVGADELLFSPRDYAKTLLAHAREHGLDRIVLDPEYSPGARAPLLGSLDDELDRADDIITEQAPVQREVQRRQLRRRAVNLNTFVATFLLSFAFYQFVGGFAGRFDYVTGAVSAGIVAAVLSGLTFERPVSPRQSLLTGARFLVYLPYLSWEITKASLAVAAIVLRPSMPIDPGMERFSPALPPGLPATTLANSITLTPGTVTVDIRGREFYVHRLTRSAGRELYDGGLERAVRFVFLGRAGARLPSPRERGEAGGEQATDGGTEGHDGREEPT